MSEMTPEEIIESYGFSDPLKAAFLSLFLMWGLSNFDGLGFLFPLYFYRMTQVALVAGGSHRLSSALYKTILDHGGEIHDLAEVSSIKSHGGAVSGVVLDDGQEIETKIVASSADPKQNFLNFFEPHDIPDDLVEAAQGWEWEKTSLFGLHLSLRKAPSYIGSDQYPDINRALITFLSASDSEELINHTQSVEDGKLSSPPLGHTTIASLFDPLQSFEDFHTGRWECLAPFDADWEALKDDYAKECLSEWKKYAPNLEPMNSFSYPPSYIDKKMKSMVRGSIKHGSYKTLQMGYNRPNDLCSQCVTPVDGFYVCGASTYPGGMVIGGPGYICANRIADDLEIKKPWKEPEYIVRARKLGIIEGF